MAIRRGADDHAVLQSGASASKGIQHDSADFYLSLFCLRPPIVTPTNCARDGVDSNCRRHGRDIHQALVNEQIRLKPLHIARLVHTNSADLCGGVWTYLV